MAVQAIIENEAFDFEIIRFSDGATSIVAPGNLPKGFLEATLTVEDERADSYINLIEQAYHILIHHSEFCDLVLNLPYLPYARADRKFSDLHGNPLQYFLRHLIFFDFQKVVLTDVHNEDAIINILNVYRSTFDLTLITRLNCFKNTVNREKELKTLLKEDVVFCAPDKGAVKDTLEIAKYYGKEYVLCEKTRNPHNGFITGLEVTAGADVEGRSVLITDDICDGGATFDIAARALKEKGAKKVYLYVTHGIFSKGINSLTNLDGVFFYNKVNV